MSHLPYPTDDRQPRLKMPEPPAAPPSGPSVYGAGQPYSGGGFSFGAGGPALEHVPPGGNGDALYPYPPPNGPYPPAYDGHVMPSAGPAYCDFSQPPPGTFQQYPSHPTGQTGGYREDFGVSDLRIAEENHGQKTDLLKSIGKGVRNVTKTARDEGLVAGAQSAVSKGMDFFRDSLRDRPKENISHPPVFVDEEEAEVTGPRPKNRFPSYIKHRFWDDDNKDEAVIGLTNLYRDQDYETIKGKLLRNRQLFEDDRFRPSNSLLAKDSSGHNIVYSFYGRLHTVRSDQIEWLRPHEICQRMRAPPPQMFVGDINRFDINQGEIGNCWFLSALSNLVDSGKHHSATFSEAFKRVVPTDQSFDERKYCGLFHFRFYSFGEWKDVVIDDKLPTRNGRLIYLRSKDVNEFWPALVEKAYAKLYGSYRDLEGGLSIEAAVDFSGGIPEIINTNNIRDEKQLFHYMLKAYNNNAFMSTSLRNTQEGVRMGLQSRHAYAITMVNSVRTKGVPKDIPLIRLRNPHGNDKEWKGDWSDNDSVWRTVDEKSRRELGLVFRDDGEFFMSFHRDFLRLFGDIEIVHRLPGHMTSEADRQFDMFHFKGQWSRSLGTARGCGNDSIGNFARNPQYFFSISDPNSRDRQSLCPVIIALAQKHVERKKEHPIGFRIYQVNNEGRVDEQFLRFNQPVGKTPEYINLREVSLRQQLGAGRYVIIPSTFSPGEEAHFLIRLFIDAKWGRAEGSQTPTTSGTPSQPARPAPTGPRRGFSHRVVNIPIEIIGEEPEPFVDDTTFSSSPKSSSLTAKIKKVGKKYVIHGLDLLLSYSKLPDRETLKNMYDWAANKAEEHGVFAAILSAMNLKKMLK